MTFAVFPLALFDILGGSELLLIMVVALMLFGGDKLPGIARGMAKIIREFRKAATEVEGEFKRAMEEDERKEAAKAAAVTPTPAPHLSTPFPPPYIPPPEPAAASLPPTVAETPVAPAPEPPKPTH